MKDLDRITQSLPLISFDTADHDEGDRADAWREHIAPYFAVQPDANDPSTAPRSSQHVVNLGEALIGLTAAHAQVFVRGKSQIASEGLDHFLIQVFLAGGGALPGQTVEPGDILIIDMGQPHIMWNDNFSHVTFVMPRGLDGRLDRTLEKLHGQTLPRRNPHVQLLGQHLEAIWATVPDLTPADGLAVARGWRGLANHLLEGERGSFDDAAPEVGTAMKQAIARYIDENLSRSISTDEIVLRFNVSRATLYRMFSCEGGIHRFIRQRRLTRAHRMLTGQPQNSVGAIGWACGFSSDTQFARAFRNHFGSSPREVRAQYRQQLPKSDCASGQSMRKWLDALSPSIGSTDTVLR